MTHQLHSAAAAATVYELVAMRARVAPGSTAIVTVDRRFSYLELISTADRFAADLNGRGLLRGDRVAILSENRWEYTVTQLACAKLGLIAACQNWRLHEEEIAYCVSLVAPNLVVASERYLEMAQRICGECELVPISELGQPGETEVAAEPEDGLHIMYTSGTTGRPKAAVVSHRAQIARMCAYRMDMGQGPQEGYISWAPMFHIGGTEHLLTTLMSGGPGVVLDGFDADQILDALEEFTIGWLLLVPATIEPLLARLQERKVTIKGVRAVGSMPDMVPASVIEAITKAVGAPFWNTFGATETGMPPLSGGFLWEGAAKQSYPKQLSMLTQLRLVDENDVDVEMGETGEACLRGPTLFSGYWNAPEANAEAFRNGWFHMGDLFRQTAEGFEFAGRSKYLIKSGGENIYPAEIERIILADPRVADAIVVRQPDKKWGEIPIAVVAASDGSLTEEQLIEICRSNLAGYKCPKGVHFVDVDAFPRNTSGKIMREQVESMVAQVRASN